MVYSYAFAENPEGVSGFSNALMAATLRYHTSNGISRTDIVDSFYGVGSTDYWAEMVIGDFCCFSCVKLSN